MRVAGIIGGLGPETSAEFYLELIARSHSKNKRQRPPILLWNVPIPNKVEEELILKGEGDKKFLPFLLEAAKNLEKGGADFIIIPCNTVHIFINEIREAVTIPVLSIVEETVAVLKKSEIKKIGFLSTELTIRKNVYSPLFKQHAISPILPTPVQQKTINRTIQNILTHATSETDAENLKTIMESLVRKRAEAIVLACTDLQHIAKEQSDIPIFDTMKILADATVREILS